MPGLSQNLEAGRTLSDVAADATASAASALRDVDVSELTLVDGRLDVEAIAAVEEPLLDLQNALVALEDAADRVQSPWLVAPLQRQLENLDEDIADNRPRAPEHDRRRPCRPRAARRRRRAPIPRRVHHPAEARGTAGFIGNWAELMVDDGQLTVDGVRATGRTSKT